ncbi:hypothetical protein K2173_003601 [Erythroxylum novogranatense]|uniref:Uncharacterized protein n=1 Tax=Erythroxylum novogranatense TaxID=1862640 RepID=A0AAV8TBU2_9ROSI|nr:hypothetical protein K2173_003601 [Erythroxylum novogranatense]
MRSIHVEQARNLAIKGEIIDAVGQGIPRKDAAKLAQKEGVKAAKLAKRQAKRIIGPIISSRFGVQHSGTLVGAYAVGFYGEQSLRHLGYLIGSQLCS